jgi:glycosyltransferase involved in cell wall biosynthesis
MRIVHVIATLDPAAGGPPGVVSRLATAQASAGADVAIFSHADPARREATATSLRGIPGMEAVRLASAPPAGRFSLPPAASAMLRDEISRADVVHLHGVWEPTLLFAGGAARSAGKPYVVAPHGMLYPWSLAQKAMKKRVALALGYRRMLQRAAALHVLNLDESAAMDPLKLRPPHIVLPNGVFPDEIEPLPDRGTFHAAHPELGGDPFILFLSRLHPGKGLLLLADAFARFAAGHPRVRLVIAGPDAGARAAFEAQIAAAGFASRVHVIGPIYGPAKFAALVDAACFCLPSEHETFSMAVTEALACGTPAVISDACHFPEVAESNAGRVVPRTVDALAAALADVFDDPAEAERMGQAGRQLVRERFTWPAIAAASLTTYGNLLRGQPGQLADGAVAVGREAGAVSRRR